MKRLAAPAVALALIGGAFSAAAATGGEQGTEVTGEELYLTGCSSCHGVDGRGLEGRGPSLEQAGAAGTYYYVRTGRMPLADVDEQPRRKEPAYSADEIDRLVDHVASLGDGPDLPDVDLSRADLAEGGELFRSNCAACHSAAGIGGALSYGRAAPSLDDSERRVVAAAVRVGPGQMPAFGQRALTDRELDSVIAYVDHLQDPPTPGGAALGGAGPLPEGFVAWVLGIGALLLASLWVGRRMSHSSEPAP